MQLLSWRLLNCLTSFQLQQALLNFYHQVGHHALTLSEFPFHILCLLWNLIESDWQASAHPCSLIVHTTTRSIHNKCFYMWTIWFLRWRAINPNNPEIIHWLVLVVKNIQFQLSWNNSLVGSCSEEHSILIIIKKVTGFFYALRVLNMKNYCR